ncbi:hypothetical protein TTRE_0000767301 [Trichuris trichiura]|uniref:ADP-ribose pyrophosphatase, mitochondrial n=1 Tax=Trichuris trichiura TaxID=36087 RepID=A0A077ZG66_TRITR|nr:hypothetical protein TTRE_0000767301 [Trichuris trichiura]
MKKLYTTNLFPASYELVRLTFQSYLASPVWKVCNSRAARSLKTWDDTSKSYVGTPWNVECCWKECDPPFTDPFFSPKFNKKDGKVDRRRIKTPCGQSEYLVRGGKPLNPAGPTGYAGRGLFPRWGPNVFVKALLVWKRKRSTYFLVQENGYAYFDGFVNNVDKNPLPKNLRQFAKEGMTRSGYGAEQRLVIFDNVVDTMKVYLSGSIPHRWNTDNAWIEVFFFIIPCHKNKKFCKALTEQSHHQFQWKRLTHRITASLMADMLATQFKTKIPYHANYTAVCK